MDRVLATERLPGELDRLALPLEIERRNCVKRMPASEERQVYLLDILMQYWTSSPLSGL